MNLVDIAWTFAAIWIGGAVALLLADDFLRRRDPSNDYEGRETLGIALWPFLLTIGVVFLIADELSHQLFKFYRWIGSALKRPHLSAGV